jgi:hypothetical protein
MFRRRVRAATASGRRLERPRLEQDHTEARQRSLQCDSSFDVLVDVLVARVSTEDLVVGQRESAPLKCSEDLRGHHGVGASMVGKVLLGDGSVAFEPRQ